MTRVISETQKAYFGIVLKVTSGIVLMCFSEWQHLQTFGLLLGECLDSTTSQSMWGKPVKARL